MLECPVWQSNHHNNCCYVYVTDIATFCLVIVLMIMLICIIVLGVLEFKCTIIVVVKLQFPPRTLQSCFTLDPMHFLPPTFLLI